MCKVCDKNFRTQLKLELQSDYITMQGCHLWSRAVGGRPLSAPLYFLIAKIANLRAARAIFQVSIGKNHTIFLVFRANLCYSCRQYLTRVSPRCLFRQV